MGSGPRAASLRSHPKATRGVSSARRHPRRVVSSRWRPSGSNEPGDGPARDATTRRRSTRDWNPRHSSLQALPQRACCLERRHDVRVHGGRGRTVIRTRERRRPKPPSAWPLQPSGAQRHPPACPFRTRRPGAKGTRRRDSSDPIRTTTSTKTPRAPPSWRHSRPCMSLSREVPLATPGELVHSPPSPAKGQSLTLWRYIGLAPGSDRESRGM
jgi:hypothetical protein